MALYGPANGNFKHGFNSMHCNPDRTLATAAKTRNDWLKLIEDVMTGRTEKLDQTTITAVRKLIYDRPSWAEFLIKRFER